MTAAILAWVLGPVGSRITALAIAAAIVLGWGEYRASQARDAMRAELTETYQKTIEEMSDADLPATPDARRRWLCERAGLTGCDM